MHDARGGLSMVLGGFGSVVRRLTAATLPAAEAAPTARVDWRRALRNILREVYEDGGRKESNCNELQLGRGD